MAKSVIIPIKSVFDDKGLKQAQSQFGKLGGGLKKALGAAAAVASIGAIANTLSAAGKAAAEDAKSQALLATQLRTTVGATDAQISATEEQIKSMSMLAGVADDEIRPAFAQLVRATGDVAQASSLTATALDIAAARGISVQSAATALGKAAQGSSGALAKLGINVKGVADPLAAVQAQFKGAAEAASNANPYQRLQVIFGEIQESLGAGVLPIVQKFAQLLIDNQPAIDSFFGLLGEVFDLLAPVADKLLKAAVKLIEPLGKLLTTILPPLIKIFDGLLQILLPIIDILINFVVDAITPLADALNDSLKPAFDGLTPLFDLMRENAGLLSKEIGEVLVMAFEAVATYADILKEVFGEVYKALAPLVQEFLDWGDSLGIDFGALIRNLNPLMIGLNVLKFTLTQVIWGLRLMQALVKKDFGTAAELIKMGPGGLRRQMEAEDRYIQSQTARLQGQADAWLKSQKPVVPTTTTTTTTTTTNTTGSKAAQEAAKRYADAYKKILETEAAIREEALNAALETRQAIESMRNSFNDLLNGIAPLKRAAGEIGDFEQQVVDSFTNIQDAISSALSDGTLLADAANELRAYAAKEQQTLAAIARQRDALTKKIDIAKAISAGILNTANITGMLESQTRTVTESFTTMVNGIQVVASRSFEEITQGGLVDNFKKVIEKTKAYAKNLIELKRLGLNGQLFKQIVDAGVEGGADAAAAVAAGGQATVTELNSLFGELNQLGANIAETSTDIMYAAGEDVMNAFIQSLLDQDAALEATAITLADKFTQAFRSRLVGLTPMPAIPMATDQISLADAMQGYVADQLGRTFTGPYNYYGQQMVGGMGSTYNVTINAGAVADKASLPGIIVDALGTYVKQSGSGALNRTLGLV